MTRGSWYLGTMVGLDAKSQALKKYKVDEKEILV